MKTYEALERALTLIKDEKDWCQYVNEDEGGRRCAAGAINLACLGTATDREEAKRIRRQEPERASVHLAAGATMNALAREAGAEESWLREALAEFNNTHTHVEVVELFQRAIRAEKQKAGVLVDVPAEAPSEVPA